MRLLTQLITGLAIALLHFAWRIDPDADVDGNGVDIVFADWIPKRIKISE